MITGIGGHYLNKRWDKALLFMILLFSASVLVLAYVIFSFQSFSGSPEEMTKLIQSVSRKASVISLLLVVLLWGVSVVVTFIDCKNNVAANMYKWSTSGIIVAAVTTLLTLLLILSTLYKSYAVLVKHPFDPLESVLTSEQDSTAFVSQNFYTSIYYGGVPEKSYTLPGPPEGDALLRGKFLFQGKPARGITLSLILNSKYEAGNIQTDSKGEFSLHLPAGTWVINSIQTSKWEEKPAAGEYSIYDGNEPGLTGSSYNRYANFTGNGLSLDIGTTPGNVQLQYTIARNIQLKWPETAQKMNKATVNSTLEWEAYPGAEQYSVSIQKIRREGNTTYYEPVAERIVDNSTQLELSSLKHYTTKKKNTHEYAVEVFAFDANGVLLSEMSKNYQGGTFTLTDKNVFIEERMKEFLPPADGDIPDGFEKKIEAVDLTYSRLRAVRTLIEAEMTVEAKTLLNQVESRYAKGKKEMLTGYIFALQGECEKSRLLLGRAKEINPNVCIPDEYRALCQ